MNPNDDILITAPITLGRTTARCGVMDTADSGARFEWCNALTPGAPGNAVRPGPSEFREPGSIGYRNGRSKWIP